MTEYTWAITEHDALNDIIQSIAYHVTATDGTNTATAVNIERIEGKNIPVQDVEAINIPNLIGAAKTKIIKDYLTEKLRG